jgi:hypothetical protein
MLPRRAGFFVQAGAQFLAGAKKRHPFFRNLNGGTGAGIASGPGTAQFGTECAKTAQFDAVSNPQSLRNGIENAIDNPIQIVLQQMWILRGQLGDKFGSGHGKPSL